MTDDVYPYSIGGLAEKMAAWSISQIVESEGGLKRFSQGRISITEEEKKSLIAWSDKLGSMAAMLPGSCSVVTNTQRKRGTELTETYSLPELPKIIHPHQLSKAVREGSTVLFSDVQFYDSFIRDIAWKVASESGSSVSATAVFSPPRAKGFIPHFDSTDNIIFQLAGSKEWNFFPKNAPRTQGKTAWRNIERYIDPDIPGPGTEVSSTQTLIPGDVLVIPSGHLHDVNGNDDYSVHVTFEHHPITRYDLESAMIDEKAHSDLMCSGVGKEAPIGSDISEAITDLMSAEHSVSAHVLQQLREKSFRELPDEPIRLGQELMALSKEATSWRKRRVYFDYVQGDHGRCEVYFRGGKLVISTRLWAAFDSIPVGEIFDLARIQESFPNAPVHQLNLCVKKMMILGMLEPNFDG